MMTTLIAVVIGLFVLVLILAALATFARARIAVLAQGRADLQQFQTAALRLVKDPDVPQSISDFAERLAPEAGHPRVAIWVAREILNGSLFRVSDEPRTDQQRQFRNDLANLSKDQLELLGQCFSFCLMSSASTTLLFPKWLRRVLYFGLFEPESRIVNDPAKARAIVVEYSASGPGVSPKRFRLPVALR
jgi:hypothetical protein